MSNEEQIFERFSNASYAEMAKKIICGNYQIPKTDDLDSAIDAAFSSLTGEIMIVRSANGYPDEFYNNEEILGAIDNYLIRNGQ